MKKTTLRSALLLLLCLAFNTSIIAQGLLYEVPMNEQVQASTQIVEGKVIAQESFWDVNHHNIYTVNTIEVYKVFKGQALATIEVITSGGTVDLTKEVVTPSLQLDKGSIGVFMLQDHSIQLDTQSAFNPIFRAYSGPQGFYAYNLFENKAVNPFYNSHGISDNFYNTLINMTGTAITEVLPYSVDVLMNRSINRGAGIINNFNPTSATAGTETVLTINGIGFGGNQGTVFFNNADSGGANFTAALGTQVLTWGDSQITVNIPSGAGTGSFIVQDEFGTNLFSPSGLTITYAQINAVSDALSVGVFSAWQTSHINRDGSGGYIWNMETSFDANAAANASFVRAMDTWRCTTDVNWTIGPVTAVDAAANDNTNIIRFDNAGELDAGVLGVNTSYFSGCFINGNTDLEWYIEELDIVFDDGTTWQFGPANAGAGEIDFETVAVHELGHGHQLGHVIDASKIMHFSIGLGATNRVLHPDDIAGASDVQNRSTTLTPCGNASMVTFDCAVLSTDDVSLEEGLSIFPNPAKNHLYIKNSSYVNLKDVTIYDVSGRLISRTDVSEVNSLYTLNVSNLSLGMYFVKVSTDTATFTQKVIIK